MMVLVAVIEGMKFKVSKMHALQLIQKALGFVCGRGTIGVDPDKTEAIVRCPRPTRPGHTDSFLGGTSFIRNHCLPQYAQECKILRPTIKAKFEREGWTGTAGRRIGLDDGTGRSPGSWFP